MSVSTSGTTIPSSAACSFVVSLIRGPAGSPVQAAPAKVVTGYRPKNTQQLLRSMQLQSLRWQHHKCHLFHLLATSDDGSTTQASLVQIYPTHFCTKVPAQTMGQHYGICTSTRKSNYRFP
ncbi:hypothetical protein AVEN_125276-1 [Araneus ventricosus]|uniref:Uncharacterized protein n=1 Tax=Araneus ventricosus TaxID=182803 RepID=A0A4Y2UAN8_ARAVE|nr:hypothetical protein AVEN_125276-1 [Araneus ventricosus]